jgi:hypothetical protein
MFKRSKESTTTNSIQGQTTERRILVVGHRNIAKGITSFDWPSLPQNHNLADYDVVIIDISVLQTNNIGHPEFAHIFNASRWNLLFNRKAKLIIIGVPRQMRVSPGEGMYGSFMETAMLLPVHPKCTLADGETMQILDSTYDFYFNIVKRWQFHFDGMYFNVDETTRAEISHVLAASIDRIVMSMEPIASNGYDRALAAKFQFTAQSIKSNALLESAQVFWLPPVTETSAESGVRLILSELFNIGRSSTEPAWIEDFQLPSMTARQIKISELDKKLHELNLERSQYSSEEADRKTLRQLLFEQGQPLEDIVKKALQELGCTIDNLPDKRSEDLRFSDPIGNKWIGEVKGRKGGLKREDIRQLDDWVKQAILNENWQGRALLIGNYNLDLPPASRPDPVSTNEAIALRRFGFCLLTTFQLFSTLKEHEETVLNLKTFWTNIASQAREILD